MTGILVGDLSCESKARIFGFLQGGTSVLSIVILSGKLTSFCPYSVNNVAEDFFGDSSRSVILVNNWLSSGMLFPVEHHAVTVVMDKLSSIGKIYVE